MTVEEAVPLPRWRGLLPTMQGRHIREAMWRGMSLWLYEDDSRT